MIIEMRHGSGADVETVVVDGRTVVDGGRVVGLSEETLLGEGQELWGLYRDKVVARDPLQRRADTLFPPAFPIRRA